MESTTDTPTITSLADQAKDNLGELAHDTKEQLKTTVSKAKEHAQEAVAQTKQKAGELIGQAKDHIEEQIVTKKETATGTLHNFASTLRDVSQLLTNDTQGPVNQYATVAANQMDRLSDYLQNRDLRELTQDAERFARQQPALFLGGAFFIGVLAARFLRSSERHQPGNESTALVPTNSPSMSTGGYTAHNYVPGGIAGGGNQPPGSDMATGMHGSESNYSDSNYVSSNPLSSEI